MKRIAAVGLNALMALSILSSTSCGSAEWSKAKIPGPGYIIISELPLPFKNADGWVDLQTTTRRPFEHSYVAEGDDDHIFQVRSMDMRVGSWQMDGFNRRAVLEFGLGRENPNSSDKILDRHDFIDPNWPNHVELAEELTIEAADGKTIRHSRVLIFESSETWCYVLLTATRPKDEPRSPDVDRFFNSLQICTGDERPGRC